MNQPKFSVITPVLNGRKDIASYVESLKSQTCKDWEAIVVDDGSTDGSEQLMRQLTAGDWRFRITVNNAHREVRGPYQARNLGLNIARGKFICFLDIDDRWLPHKLATQSEQFEINPELRLVYSRYIRVLRGEANGKIRHAHPWLGPHFWIKIANPVPMLTACVQRDSISGIEFEPINHEDYLFWHKTLQRLQPGEVAEHLEPLAIYYVSNYSISSNKMKATGWIWKCYRRLGHSRRKAAASLLVRGILQGWTILSESGRRKNPVPCRVPHNETTHATIL